MIAPQFGNAFSNAFQQGAPLGAQGFGDWLQWYSRQMQLALAQQQQQRQVQQWQTEEQRRQAELGISQQRFGLDQDAATRANLMFPGQYAKNQADLAQSGFDLKAAQGKDQFMQGLSPAQQQLVYAGGGKVPEFMMNPASDPGYSIAKSREEDARRNLDEWSKMLDRYSVRPQSPMIAMLAGGGAPGAADPFLPKPIPLPGKEKEYEQAWQKVSEWQQKMVSAAQYREQYEQGLQARGLGGMPGAAQSAQPFNAGFAPPTSQPAMQQPATPAPANPAPSAPATQPQAGAGVDQRALMLKAQALQAQLEREMPAASPQEKRAAFYMRAKATGWTPEELSQL